MSGKKFSRAAITLHLHCASRIWFCLNSEDVRIFFSFSFSINQSHKKFSYEYFLLCYLPYFHILIPHRVLFFCFSPLLFVFFLAESEFSISLSLFLLMSDPSRFRDFHTYSLRLHFYIYYLISFFSLCFFHLISLSVCLSICPSISAFLSLFFSLCFPLTHNLPLITLLSLEIIFALFVSLRQLAV